MTEPLRYGDFVRHAIVAWLAGQPFGPAGRRIACRRLHAGESADLPIEFHERRQGRISNFTVPRNSI
ncbi:hypothetical protein [Burkholderia stagnalis]